MIPVHNAGDGARFAVKVQPRAKRNAIVGQLGDALKIALTAPPLEGRANQALVEFLAEILNVPRSSITIAAGQSSRRKVVAIAGLSAEEAGRRFAPFLTPET
ncbi:MAG TPA: DUF167 domain-containing protein [Terriglobales bacterium]|nr:DUF167 domain-containing protein [Terriglobales bacterium]